MSDISKNLDTFYRKCKIMLYEKALQYNTDEADALNFQEVVCMEIIVALDGPTVSNFAKYARLSNPNAAYRVQKLVEKGYVSKVQDTEDKRTYYLVPTEKYAEQIGLSSDYIDEVSERIEERFSPEDVKKFDEMLHIICTELTPELGS